MTTLYNKIDTADWSFVGTWREDSARDAASYVHRRNSLGHSDELDDLEQHAMLYCATHPKAINNITTPQLLFAHVKSRLVQDFRRDWERDAGDEGFGSEGELYEVGGADLHV